MANNPLPRTGFSLSAFKVNPTSKTLAESVKVNGVSPREEAKANQIVADILDSAEIEVDKAAKEQEEYDRIAEAEAEAAYEERSRVVESRYTGGFRLPPREESGLFNPSIELDESQIEAVERLAPVQYGCLIGAAGTGKTTVQKYLIQRLIYGVDGKDPEIRLKQLESKSFNVALVAFTGMAVQVIKSNLPTWFQGSAATIHGLLEFAPEEYINKRGEKTRIFMPQRHQFNKLDVDCLIIDEASMLGLELWKQLLDALKPGTRIYMTGDLNQLPPIIGQPIFAYALSHWTVAELTKVHRQKEKGANRIVEVAHEILNGKEPTFDKSEGNPDWRVIGFDLPDNVKKAQQQILAILNQVRKRRVNQDDPDSPLIYDPYRDRVMTAGNGYDENIESSMVQQHPINEALSMLIQPPDPEHQRIIIDAGRSIKKFANNLRVMATKNESVTQENRVTNGLTGRILAIEPNPNYTGDARRFGPEEEIKAHIKSALAKGGLGAFGANIASDSGDEKPDLSFDDDMSLDGISLQGSASGDEEVDSSGIASHTVHVAFDNGAIRKYSSKAGVDSLQLAYASTVAKCQGSQFDTAIIIVHPAQKGQLSREWLYTAVTRATKRVIILKTSYGMRLAINRQKIVGRTIAEKVMKYYEMCSEAGVEAGYGARMRVNVPLTIETYDPSIPTYERVK